MSADVSFLRSLADEIDGSELTHSWRRDRDWLREIATKLAAAEAALAACEERKARKHLAHCPAHPFIAMCICDQEHTP